MAKELKLDLPTLDDMFTTQENRDKADSEQIMDIPISLIDNFPDHPFKVRGDEDMVKLVDSISDNGILVPVIVRSKNDGRYEMIAGHRRKIAAMKNDIRTVPGVVRNLTDDEATIVMVDSNLQREKILPSERAFSYKMKLEAMKRQGKRTDLTSDPMGRKLKGKESVEIIAEDLGESRNQIRRYIRLTELIPEILQMVDDEQIAFRPAVELSYLSNDEQQILLESMQLEEATPSLAQAIKLKQASQEERFEDVIVEIMTEQKPNQVEQFKIPKDKIKRYFPEGTPKEKIEQTIIKALELYKRRERDMER